MARKIVTAAAEPEAVTRFAQLAGVELPPNPKSEDTVRHRKDSSIWSRYRAFQRRAPILLPPTKSGFHFADLAAHLVRHRVEVLGRLRCGPGCDATAPTQALDRDSCIGECLIRVEGNRLRGTSSYAAIAGHVATEEDPQVFGSISVKA